MINTPDVSIIIACYNEALLLRQSVADIVATMDASRYTYELIFIDDTSQDQTPEIIREICAGKANYRYVLHAQNVGRGGTVVEGLRLSRGKVAGFLDIDLEVHPRYITSLVSAIMSGSCSVGTVARAYNFSWHPMAFIRTILSIGCRRIVTLTLALPFTDTETGYKFFNRRRIMPILDECRNKGWFWDTEIMALSHKAGLRILEVPGLFVRRHDKKSSVKILRDTITYAKDLSEFRNRTKVTESPGAAGSVDNLRKLRPENGIEDKSLQSPPKSPIRAFVEQTRTGLAHRKRQVSAPVPASRMSFSPSDLFVSLSLGLATFSNLLKSKKENIAQRLRFIGTKSLVRFQRSALVFAVPAVIFALFFLSYHALILTYPNYTLIERIMTSGLLVCQIFFVFTGVGYILGISRAGRYQSAYDQYFSGQSSSSVSCLMPVCDEPIEVISETLASVSAMRYDNKKIYILDDSSKDENIENIRNLAREFGATLIRRKNRLHYKAGNINNALKQIKSDYVAIFDADQRPSLDFLRDLIPLLDEEPRLALVQTPQDYENTESFMAGAAALSNSLFYGYIAESKDVSGAMFCCGTNCILRLDALKDIDGFDTATLTEDFATTLKLHIRGWKTRFVDKIYVMGVGPETLGKYMKQYTRWATGTLQLFKTAVKTLFTKPRSLTASQWFEYSLSFSYYLSGLANFYLLLLPAAIILFGIDLVKDNALMYLLFLSVYILSFWSLFLLTSVKKGYPALKLITVHTRLEICKFYIYTKAFVSALLGRKPSFEVTGKGSGGQLRWSYLTVPLAILALNALSAFIGMYRLGIVFHPYLAVNTIWSAHNVWQLSAIIQYNSGSESQNLRFFSRFKGVARKTPPTVRVSELEVS